MTNVGSSPHFLDFTSLLLEGRAALWGTECAAHACLPLHRDTSDSYRKCSTVVGETNTAVIERVWEAFARHIDVDKVCCMLGRLCDQSLARLVH